MRERTLDQVARAVGGEVVPASAGAAILRAVSIDSRKAGPGQLFVALPGERSDGHAFVADAVANGASAALVATSRDPGDARGGPIVRVADPAAALLELARQERNALSATVVGITGSTGKTCTKDLTAAVLAERFRVVASLASFNNEVGLPLTILSADEATEAIVCEMGSRGPGHIRLLCDVARPQVGVVTNVGTAHMELFGSPEVLRDAKAELPESLPEGGTAVLNADDRVVRTYAGRTRATTLLFGLAPDAAVRAGHVVVRPRSGTAAFDVITPGGVAPVELAVPGEHMVPNALAAAAVGHALGLSVEEIAKGLSGARVTAGRMDVFETEEGVRILDDSYNANPTSMAAALRSARWMAGDGRCIAVLGTMAELGPISAEEHERVGELLARLGIDVLVAVGPEARLTALGAEREGVEPERIFLYDDVDQAVETVRRVAAPGDLVLVKASRAARLERIAEALRSSAGSIRPTIAPVEGMTA
jgi:UDP-N-acetylmuramoyl-tripeptide--D-alanyl-D-alanine ligase